mgnify:CR=1 FL=1|jgi:hypothetical protein
MWNKVDDMFEKSEQEERQRRSKEEMDSFLQSIKVNTSSIRLIISHVNHLLQALDNALIKNGVEVKDAKGFYINVDQANISIYDYCLKDADAVISYGSFRDSEIYWISPRGKISLSTDKIKNVITGLRTHVGNSYLPTKRGYSYRVEDGYIFIHQNGPYGNVLGKISVKTGKIEKDSPASISKQEIIRDFVKGFFPNEYESLREDIEEGNISTLVDIQQELDCGNQIELLERFEYWVSNEYSYSKETTTNILDLVKGVFSDWNNYSISEGEDDFYSIERILKGKSKLSYTVAHSSGGPKHYIRDVEIKFK